MAGTLENLLMRLRDGSASADDLAQARSLARSDARLPEELRDEVLVVEGEAASDAAALLMLLGAPDPLTGLLGEAVGAEAGEPAAPRDAWDALADGLREGLRAEAGEIDLAEAVGQRIGGWPWSAAVAEAVRVEAGEAEVDAEVLAALELSGPPVAEAVRWAAGEVEVAQAVMAALSIEGPAVREAVAAEAGSVDVAASVMAAVAPVAASPVVVAPAPTPAPANDARGWTWAGVALAAVALVVVVVGQLGSPFGAGLEPAALSFAQAGEIVVEDLSYGDDVQVFQTEGEQGAVIIWVDEEA